MTKPESKIFDRVLLKISGESLQGDRESGISNDASEKVARIIKRVHDMGVGVVVVIGGGNLFRGAAAAEQGFERVSADHIGMLATLMNALALDQAMKRLDGEVELKSTEPIVKLASRAMSAVRIDDFAEYYIRDKAARHLDENRTLIIGAGIGKSYVTSDTGAAQYALELGCDVIVKATKVDGVYDKDPVKYKDARRYRTLNFKDAIDDDAVRVMDKGALAMCNDNNMRVLILDLLNGDNLSRAVRGENIGTLVANDIETKFADES